MKPTSFYSDYEMRTVTSVQPPKLYTIDFSTCKTLKDVLAILQATSPMIRSDHPNFETLKPFLLARTDLQ